MATTIKLKNGSGAPLAGDLVQGEPALDLTNKRLYTEDSGGTVIEVGTNPSTLTVNNASDPRIRINNSATSLSANTVIGGLEFYTNDASGGGTGVGASIDSYAEGNFGSNQQGLSLRFSTRDSGSGETNTERMRIDSSGDVFIKDGGELKVERSGASNFSSFFTDTGDATIINNSWANHKIVLTRDGNVGIGTTSPGYKLHVAGEVYSAGRSTGYGYRLPDWRMYNETDNSIVWTSGSNERMRIDSSGNVGIGTTSPSSYYATELVIDCSDEGGITLVGGTTEGQYLMFADGTSGNSQYRGFISYDHNIDDFTVNSRGTVRFQSGSQALEAMRIDSSGRVGIGNTNPSYPLEVTAAGSVLARLSATDSNQAYMAFTNSTTGGGLFADGIIVGLDSDESAVFYNFEATPMRFGTSGSERMRIDSSGNVLIHGTTRLASSILNVDGSGEASNGISAKVNNDAYWSYVGINASGTNTFLVYGDGDVENTNNSYGAISDERLKSNIVDASSQIDDIMAVQVRSYTLDSTGDTYIGVVAQELEASGMSGLVKTNDEGMKSVKYSILYMKAIKALQEAVTRIETLEAEVAALKGA